MLDGILLGASILSVTYTLFLLLKEIRIKMVIRTGKSLKLRLRTKKILWLMVFSQVLCLVAAVFIIGMEISYRKEFGSGVESMNLGDYEEAQVIFERLDNSELLYDSRYEYAKKMYYDGKLQEASRIFEELGDYKSSEQFMQMILLTMVSETNDVQDSQYSVAYNLYSDGQFCRALNYFEKLGDYKNSEQMREECIASMREMSAHTISAGISLAVGIDNNGKVVTAGDKKSYNFKDWDNIISISNLGVIAIGLKENGTVITSGERSVDVSAWENIVAVAAGERYVVGLKSDGTVVGAGHDQGDGQLQVNGWTDIVAIATGWRHTVGLDSDGNVHITGYGSSRQLREISNSSEWKNIVAIAAGGGDEKGKGHTVGLRADGTVVAVGDNTYGQCNVDKWENIVAIAAGDWHTVGLCADGTVISTKPDSNKYPDLYTAACDVEGWTNIVEIAAGSGLTIGLREDGKVEALGFNDSKQREEALGWEDLKVRTRE